MDKETLGQVTEQQCRSMQSGDGLMTTQATENHQAASGEEDSAVITDHLQLVKGKIWNKNRMVESS